MKTLLKLCIVAAVLVLGMSSCLKNDDSISFSIPNAYILQTENDKFIPQMRVVNFDYELKSALFSIEGGKLNLRQLSGMNIWEIPSYSFNEDLGFDSISSNQGVLTLTGINGNSDTHQYSFYPTIKKIGDINVDTLEYNSSDNDIYIKLSDTVKNADLYYLMIQSAIGEQKTTYTMWTPYADLDIEKDQLSAKVSVDGLVENTHRFAVGARYLSVYKVDEKFVTVTVEE